MWCCWSGGNTENPRGEFWVRGQAGWVGSTGQSYVRRKRKEERDFPEGDKKQTLTSHYTVKGRTELCVLKEEYGCQQLPSWQLSNSSAKVSNIQSEQPWQTVLSVTQCPDSVWPHGLQPGKPLCPRDSPGKDTRVDCHFLLQWQKVNSW